MTSIHEPTPEFDRFLEWQVTSALRRHDRFAEPASSGYRRYRSAAAAAIVALLVGAVAGASPGRIQDSQQKTFLLQQQQSELQVAQAQVSLAESLAQNLKRRADVGTAPPEDVVTAERHLQETVLKVQRIQLNLEEVRISGRSAQDDLTAPRVSGRDFVTERLLLEQKAAAMTTDAAERTLRDAQKRFDVGLVPSLEVDEARSALVRAVTEANGVREKIALRERLLAGKLTPEETTRQRLLSAAKNEMVALTAECDVLEKRFTTLEAQFKAGVTGEVDVLRARLEMVSRKQDLDRLRTRIAALEQGRIQ